MSADDDVPTWVFDDGTRFELGGAVTGTSAFAERLRKHVHAAGFGVGPAIFTEPPPNGLTGVDMANAVHVQIWLYDQSARYGVPITQQPHVEMPEPTVRLDDEDEGGGERIY